MSFRRLFVSRPSFLADCQTPRLLMAALLLLTSLSPGRVRAAQAGGPGTPDYSQPWQTTSYSEQAGVLQQRFFDIAFTADDTAWLAADDGLHEFDGFDWTLFGTNQGLPSSFVRAVCVDRQDELWVGSDAGAGIWSRQQERYEAKGIAGGLANDNVREIDQDPDGTLWFACDQWPEAAARPGGLSSYQDGWHTFRETNGVPMDYVIGYFRDSGGRQFVLTPHGWGMRRGNRWGPPPGEGYEVEERVLQMAEGRDGTLFAQGEQTLLTFDHDRWRSRPESHTRCLCTTRSGEVAAVEYDPVRGQLWFSLWDGEKFVRASSVVACPAGGRLYHLREAPDGSLWCVGTGTVVRWAYGSGKWTFYPQLPSPLAADKAGRVWFADESNLVVRANQAIRNVAAGNLRVWAGEQQMMIWDRSQHKLFVTDAGDPEKRIAVESGCENVTFAAPGTNGIWWILGQNEDTNGFVARYENGQCKAITTPELAWRQLSAARAQPSAQVWFVAAHWESNSYEVGCLAGDGIEWQKFTVAPPSVRYPTVLAAAGRCWISSYSGIFEQSLTDPGQWTPVGDLPVGGFTGFLGTSNEALLTFSGGRSGHPGCALFTSNQWHRLEGDFVHPTFGLDERTIFLPSRNGVFIRRQPGTLDLEYLQAPANVTVHVAVRDLAGNIWLGTSDGTFCYQPRRQAPKTVARAAVTEIRRLAPLPVVFGGRERFWNESSALCFRYSWRLDGGAWSPFVAWPGQTLALPKLPPGKHALAVRARDVDGNVAESPAVVNIRVLADPLQTQPWFIGLVTVAALALAWLSRLRFVHVRQIAAANTTLRQEIAVRRKTEEELIRARAELELRVTHRTEQLTRANEQLKRGIIERQKAEEHQRSLEEQLHQAQKMEAIGTLAGGIAHDFNNILAIIIPYCEIVRAEVGGRTDLQEHLDEMLQAANRARDLVQQILTFSHRQRRQPRQVCDIRPALKEALKLLRSALPSSIEMRQDITATHPVSADPTQIHQVVMNLCVNAQHAMEGRQGLLEVRLDECVMDEVKCERHADLRPGLYVRLTVRDNGCGIPPENLKRIFEPFFTTREVGRGTGLGLAVVHGIVRDHDGVILVESEAGRGTEFQVLLPAEAAVLPENGPALPAVPAARGQRILIVDDEESLIKVLKRLLTRAGYQVAMHTNPQAALADFLSRPTDIALILTDLTMPGMNGLELAARIHKVRRDLPMILATGFGGDLITTAQLASHPNIRKVMEKPLETEAILRAVSELLERESAEKSEP